MTCPSVNFDLFMSGPLVRPDSSIRWASYRGSQQAKHTDAFDAHDGGARMRAVLVLLDDGREAARHGTGHPVGRQPGAGQIRRTATRPAVPIPASTSAAAVSPAPAPIQPASG